MDAGTLAQWAAVALSAAALLIAWATRRSEKIQDIEARQDRFDGRLQKIEADVTHLPGKDLVHALQISLVEMKGKMDVISAKVEPIKAISDRLQNWMLEEHK